MQRRDFLRRTLELSAAGLIVPSALQRGSFLSPKTASASSGDPFAGQILVIINLNGGNDGLNTVVPYNDAAYSAARPTLAFQPGEVLQIEPLMGTGLHPAMTGFESLYNSGELAIVQGVGYPNMNLSHFRGTDIWFSGSSEDQIVETGWLARFIEKIFVEFPDQLPTAPYGLQQSLAHRIPMQGDRGVTGVIVDNPDTFYQLVGTNYTGEYNDDPPETRGGDELEYLREIDTAAFEYAEAIQDAADNGTNTVNYPATNLGFQLEIVAKLISGSLGTPIFLTAEYGFDTHATQDAAHAGLLGSLGASVQAFMQDLENQGLKERVLVVTQSEFGRRVGENGSFGTDHGTAAPMFLIGQQVLGGMYGANPDLLNLDQNGNLLVQNDYRAIYSSILQGHFGASASMAQEVLFGDYGTLDFLNPVSSTEGNGLPRAHKLHPVEPNPIRLADKPAVRVRFDLPADERVLLEVFDIQGRRVGDLADRVFPGGAHQVQWQPENLTAGTYILRMTARGWQRSTKAVVIP